MGGLLPWEITVRTTYILLLFQVNLGSCLDILIAIACRLFKSLWEQLLLEGTEFVPVY